MLLAHSNYNVGDRQKGVIIIWLVTLQYTEKEIVGLPRGKIPRD